jgi:hypothetical protein
MGFAPVDYRGLVARCAGCARRAATLWALIDPDAAINLHATRTATERRGGADLIGGASNWISLKIIRTTVFGGDAWLLDVTVTGDQAAFFDATASATILEGGAAKVSLPFGQSEYFTDTTFAGESPCVDVDTPDGYTEGEYEASGTGVTDDLVTGAVSVLVKDSMGETVLAVSGATLCQSYVFASQNQWYFEP